MLFNSVAFLVFFPIVLLVYMVLPKRARAVWLLLASFYFYASWNVRYTVLLLASIGVTYAGARLIASADSAGKKKAWLAGSIVINLAILGLFKYFGLFVHTINALRDLIGRGGLVNPLNFLLPVGISFYTFQAIGYVVDVYRGDVESEKNLIKYALFVSFFPQLVAGPIERSGNLLKQIKRMDTETLWSVDDIEAGALTMLYGYVMKVILADRMAAVVTTVYDPANLGAFSGFQIVLASVLFSLQIYCDFAGYTFIAIGAARTMGIKIRDNFNAPYLAESIKDFWDRWHISLSTWFRDYLYFPLGGSRKGRLRKYVNIIIVFFVSGLWHGSAYHFAVWGLLHGFLRVLGELTDNARKSIAEKLDYDRSSFSHRCLAGLGTFILVTFCWIFFRAESTDHALRLIKNMISAGGLWQLTDGSLLALGLDGKEFNVLVVFGLIMLIADICKKKGKDLNAFIRSQNVWFRFALFFVGIMATVIFGAYGETYNASEFIYFQF